MAEAARVVAIRDPCERSMSGQIVARPAARHACNPGWRNEFPRRATVRPRHVRHPSPDASDYPKGTVWECECGRTWVSTGPIAPSSPGFIDFRREHWLERHRRLRREARSQS